MKRQHRKMTPLLVEQLAVQDKRIREAGILAFIYSTLCTYTGTMFSDRADMMRNPNTILHVFHKE